MNNIGIDVPILNRVASVFVHVSDLRVSAEWYCLLLGLPLMEERLNGGPVYWFDMSGTGLILDNNSGNRQNPDWRESMMPRYMYAAADIDRAYSYMKERAEVWFEPDRHPGMAYFNFADPEGNAFMACWSEYDDAAAAEPSGTSPVLPRIGGVFVDVRDMRAMSKWYSELLGLPWREQDASQSIYTIGTTTGAAILLDDNRHRHGQSFRIPFMFDTPDMEAAYRFAAKEGFRLFGEPESYPSVAFFTLQDPDGNLVMICENREK